MGQVILTAFGSSSSSWPEKIQPTAVWDIPIRQFSSFSRTEVAILGALVVVCLSSTYSDAHSATPNNKNSVFKKTMTPKSEHSETTLALAQKESAEHMEGMQELYEAMRIQPLIVKAYALDDPKAPADAKVVHFVRHGQGVHNLIADIFTSQGRTWIPNSKSPDNPYMMPEIMDAPLTEKGRQQAYAVQPLVKSMTTKPELVVLSPQCRALQTGLIAFEELLSSANGGSSSSVPLFVAHEMVREQSGVHICDKRRPTSHQAKEFPQVDFSLLESEEDVIFQEDHRETKAEVGARVYKFLEWLSQRPEKHIGVSSHSAWLLTVFNGILECDDSLKAWFQTGEMRSVKLEFIERQA